MIWQLLAGASVGGGILLVVYALSRPVPGIAATLSRLDRSRPPGHSLTVSAARSGLNDRFEQLREGTGGRLEVEETSRGWHMHRMHTDLAVMNCSVTTHLSTKVLLRIDAFLWFSSVV